MRLQSRQEKRRRSEPTTALINIVFLMLIFFLVAAQIAPPLEKNLELVSTADLEGREPPDAMVVMAGGNMIYRGREVTPEHYVTIMQEKTGTIESVRLVPDRSLSAVKLIEIGNQLRQAGVGKILLVTERSRELAGNDGGAEGRP